MCSLMRYAAGVVILAVLYLGLELFSWDGIGWMALCSAVPIISHTGGRFWEDVLGQESPIRALGPCFVWYISLTVFLSSVSLFSRTVASRSPWAIVDCCRKDRYLNSQSSMMDQTFNLHSS